MNVCACTSAKGTSCIPLPPVRHPPVIPSLRQLLHLRPCRIERRLNTDHISPVLSHIIGSGVGISDMTRAISRGLAGFCHSNLSLFINELRVSDGPFLVRDIIILNLVCSRITTTRLLGEVSGAVVEDPIDMLYCRCLWVKCGECIQSLVSGRFRSLRSSYIYMWTFYCVSFQLGIFPVLGAR